MDLNGFKQLLLSKFSGRNDVVIQDQELVLRMHTAAKHIATHTIPLTLIKREQGLSETFRRIDENSWIRMPRLLSLNATDPIELRTIDMDSQLLDAMAYYVAAGLEPQRGSLYMALYWEEINLFNYRLSEIILVDEGTKDSERDTRFP